MEETSFPQCPSCKVNLVEDDVIDTYTGLDDGGLDLFCVGHCPRCNKEYEWRQHFTPSHFYGTKELK